MKKLILVITLMLIASISTAQFAEKHAIYIEESLLLGNRLGYHVGLNYVYNNKYSIQLSRHFYSQKADNIPSDYSGSIFTLGLDDPRRRTHMFGLSVGRAGMLNARGTIRLNIKVGVAYTAVEGPTNWEEVVSLLGATHIYDYKIVEQNVGFIIQPEFEFLPTRVWGLGLSPLILLNRGGSFIGMSLTSKLGLLRGRRKAKPSTIDWQATE